MRGGAIRGRSSSSSSKGLPPPPADGAVPGTAGTPGVGEIAELGTSTSLLPSGRDGLISTIVATSSERCVRPSGCWATSPSPAAESTTVGVVPGVSHTGRRTRTISPAPIETGTRTAGRSPRRLP
jgi:hypothetical protein